MNDEGSRAFWEGVERGARQYDALPEWRKGVLADSTGDKPERTSESRGADPAAETPAPASQT